MTEYFAKGSGAFKKKKEEDNVAFNKAMKSLNSLEVSFAKFRVGMAGKARLKVYKKLASLLRIKIASILSLTATLLR